jgi:hypothetical protein
MTTSLPVGWVLRAGTTDFAVGCRVLEPNVPRFGDLVKVPLQDNSHVFGLIYNVQVADDLAVRQLILAGDLESEVIKDQRENRLVPIELSVLVVGYQHERHLSHGLPPQPPLSLDQIVVCTDTDLRAFTRLGQTTFKFDYLRLALNAPFTPADELLIANLNRAAAAHAPEVRRPFLLAAGRELARLLSFDLVRLDGILRRIRPE